MRQAIAVPKNLSPKYKTSVTRILNLDSYVIMYQYLSNVYKYFNKTQFCCILSIFHIF